MSETKVATTTGRAAFVVTAGADRLGRVLKVFGEDVLVKVSSRDTASAFSVTEERTPSMAGPPLHVHHQQDEWFHILEGEYLFEVDGKELRAHPGDILFAPRGSRHTFQNVGSTPARSMITVVPGGLDLFFEEVLAVCPAGSAPDPEKLVPLFRKYGMELLGPPIGERKASAA